MQARRGAGYKKTDLRGLDIQRTVRILRVLAIYPRFQPPLNVRVPATMSSLQIACLSPEWRQVHRSNPTASSWIDGDDPVPSSDQRTLHAPWDGRRGSGSGCDARRLPTGRSIRAWHTLCGRQMTGNAGPMAETPPPTRSRLRADRRRKAAALPVCSREEHRGLRHVTILDNRLRCHWSANLERDLVRLKHSLRS